MDLLGGVGTFFLWSTIYIRISALTWGGTEKSITRCRHHTCTVQVDNQTVCHVGRVAFSGKVWCIFVSLLSSFI